MFRALKGASVCETSKVEVRIFLFPSSAEGGPRSAGLFAQQRETKLGSQKPNFEEKGHLSKQQKGGPESIKRFEHGR